MELESAPHLTPDFPNTRLQTSPISTPAPPRAVVLTIEPSQSNQSNQSNQAKIRVDPGSPGSTPQNPKTYRIFST
ncbi:hypothetical protein HMPREF0580_0834 [Mobiluncus mulieris ATCC 35239]|uniref:Uncharacterized protein n=1 Tax=Mobiluncus mulieris ATCC 35239 TaxID=871571 RepID=E0QPL9_9ACTO|nr:hypothetical protein HMPREF0580_0834 [Mobiluncus mulieris ATCC 35239]